MTPYETPEPTTKPQNPSTAAHSDLAWVQTKQHLAIPQTDHHDGWLQKHRMAAQ